VERVRALGVDRWIERQLEEVMAEVASKHLGVPSAERLFPGFETGRAPWLGIL
jgi:hypothetical protein